MSLSERTGIKGTKKKPHFQKDLVYMKILLIVCFGCAMVLLTTVVLYAFSDFLPLTIGKDVLLLIAIIFGSICLAFSIAFAIWTIIFFRRIKK